MPNDLPTIAPETLEMIARLKVEYGVSTNTEVLREALRRARPAKDTTAPNDPILDAAANRHTLADVINRARYRSPEGGLPERGVDEEDRNGRDYAYRIADAVLSAIPHLAAHVRDVAGLVIRFRSGEPCSPPCKVMDARSGCICAEAADGLAAIAAERDRASAELDGLLGEMLRLAAERDEAREALHYANGVCDLALKHRDAAEAERDALAERLRVAEADRDMIRDRAGTLNQALDDALADLRDKE